MDRVYVGNLPPNIRIKDIDDFFRPFGNLVYIDVNHRANPVYALVQFDNPRNAFMAMKSRHGYNYDGYNLQLRLVENEVRKRRDPTPPPPPPSMFNKDFDMQNNRGGFGNNYDNFSNNNNNRMVPNYSNSSASSFQSSQWGSFDNYNYNNSRSNVSQHSSDYRMSTGQQNIMDYPPNNRSNISYSSSGRSNMSQENMNFSNRNQSIMNYSNNNSDWGNNNLGGGSYGGGNNFTYNASQDPYTNANFEDNYTRGLSGAGRKWFNRYIREGYSAAEARAKALERRTVPYLRDDPKRSLAVNNSTNAALENIGTTIMSLLSKTAVDKSGNQLMPSFSKWGGDNYQSGGDYNMPGPSRGRGEPRNAVSQQQYLKSLNILKRIQSRGSRDANDRLSKKYHTQIVNDYERYQKLSRNERDKKNVTSSSIEGKSYTQLLVAFKKKKQQLLIGARKMSEKNETKNSNSGSFRTKIRMLMDKAGCTNIEARALAVHQIRELQILMSMKADYEAALKKKQEKFPSLMTVANQKSKKYRRELNYLRDCEKMKNKDLNSRLKTGLRAVLNRLHRYERERNLPLTKSKFDRLLLGANSRRSRRRPKRDGAKDTNKANVSNENVTDENTKNEQPEPQDSENVTEEQHDDGNNQDAENTEQNE